MSKNTRFKRALAQLLAIVLTLSMLPVGVSAAEIQPPNIASATASASTAAYPDFAAFLENRDPAVYGTAQAPGAGNIAPLLSAMTHLRQSSQGNAASNASFAFNHIRSIPAAANANAHWNTQGANGQNRTSTGTVGIAVDLLEGAPANTPWPVADTVVIYASLHNNTPFHPPANPTLRGIGRVSIESGSHAAFAAQPSANTHQTWNWGSFANNSSSIATLETNEAAQWSTFGNVVEIQPNNANRVFVFSLDEPVPVRYLRALIEIIVPDGATGGLGAQISISSFEVYNSRAGQQPRHSSSYPNISAFLTANDPTNTGMFGTVHAAGASSQTSGLLNTFDAPNSSVVRASSWSNAVGNPTNAIDGLRQDSFGNAANTGSPPIPGRAGSWTSQGAADHNNNYISNMGIAINLGGSQTFDTVVIYAGRSAMQAFIPEHVPSVTIETGTLAAFNSLPTAQSPGHAAWPSVGATGWELFASPISTNTTDRVFVFRTDVPITAEAVRVILPKAVDIPINQTFINAFEVYNSRNITQPTIVAPPTANPAPGHFRVAQNITLSTTTPRATIHFTTDGTTPTTESTIFTTPIVAASDMTIQAIAVYNGVESDIAEFTYTISEFAPSPFSEFYLSQPGDGFAVINVHYDGMSNVIGRPALVDVTRTVDKFPVFRAVNGRPGAVIVGTLHGPDDMIVYVTSPIAIDADGNATITIPDTVPLVEMVTYRMAFTLTYNGRTLRDSRFFTAIDNFDNYRATPNIINSFNTNVANVPLDNVANPFPALLLVNDRLVYFPDYRGNRIMDYSAVGFRGGAEIPNVPIVREIGPFNDPYRDAWRMIQDAIDYVSARPIDPETGFRGALYLREGVYRISQPLLVAASGVVIRGAGEGVPQQTSTPRYPAAPDRIPGSPQNPMISHRACQEFEPGVTKLISTWVIDPDYVQTNMGHGGTTGVFRVESTSVNRNSSNNWDTLIHIIGQPILNTATNFQSNIVDQYVGIGQYTVHLESVEGLNVGDLVFIYRAIDPNWARSMYMHAIGGANGGWVIGDNLAPGFAPNPRSSLYHERIIAHIDTATNAVTFDVAMPDSIDMRWGTSYVLRYTYDNRIRNVGVESVQGISHFPGNHRPRSEAYGIHIYSYNCENHPMQFISMTNVVDGFARNWVSYHFDRGFTTNTVARNITVQDAFVLEPVSLATGGARRYALYIRHGNHVLMQRTYAHYSRHAFSWSSYVSGPSVFFDSDSPFVTNASEPHFRWSSGGLFDNVRSRIYVNNRWDFGTSHGWAGVNYVLYNTFGTFIASQPQIAPNFVIGHWWDNTPESRFMYGAPNAGGALTGRVNFQRTTQQVYRLIAYGINGGIVPNFPAYEFGLGRGRPVNPTDDNMPDSLFIQQVLDARGPEAVAIVKGNTSPDRSYWIWAEDATIDPVDQTEPLLLTSLMLDGVQIAGFAPRVFSYTYTLPFGFAHFPVVTATSTPNVDIIISTPTMVDMRVIITLIDRDHPHNREEYVIVFDSPSRTPILTSSWQQAPPFATDHNFTLNLLLGNTTHPDSATPRWASNVNPSWLRLYLGYTPKMVEGVNIGFVPGGPIRRYMVRFEYSLDGLTWKPVEAGTVFSPETPSQTPWTFTSRPSGEFVNSLPVEGTINFPDNGLQHFVFDTPVEARFIRVWGDGRFDGTTYSAWNNYWHLSPRLAGGTGLVDSESIVITGDDTAVIGSEITLTAIVAPINATFDDVLWGTSDPSIAHIDVSRGIVTALMPGTVTITATTLDGEVIPNTGIMIPFYTATFELTVVEASPPCCEEYPDCDCDEEPITAIFSLQAFNNGVINNHSLANGGTIRIWTQLDGVGALVPYEGLIVTAVLPDGECAMHFVNVNRIWNNLDYVNLIDVNMHAPWQMIYFTAVSHGQTVELTLINPRFFGLQAFNNGVINNQSLANGGIIRIWTQLASVSALVPYSLTVTAIDQNGECAMYFVRINEPWANPGYVNFVDVNFEAAWRYIYFTATVFGQTVDLMLINPTPPVAAPEFSLNVFNNGVINNQSLADAGLIRLWTRLDGVNANVLIDEITATDQDGNDATEHLRRINTVGVSPQNGFDVNFHAPWQQIYLTITAYGQTLELILVNPSNIE